MKEQIEEMACEKCLHHLACLTNSEYVPTPCPAYEDKAGYRKQSEGEWVENEDDFWILCSVCGIELWDEQEDKKTPYCPFCGAKMNGIKKEFNHGGFESQALN